MSGNLTGSPRRRANDTVLRDYGLTILVAILVALVIRFFVIEAYRIPTAAMRPTLESGDTIFVGKWQFGLRIPLFQTRITQGRMPRRGEVVLYSPLDDARREIIKRVIGLPGETIQIRQGRVSIDGQPLPVLLPRNTACGTERLPNGDAHGACWEPPPLQDFGPEKLPEDSVFALSDMRSGSSTEGTRSRAYAVVPISAIRGKALWTWLSIQPQTLGQTGGFPQFRFERMFRRIE